MNTIKDLELEIKKLLQKVQDLENQIDEAYGTGNAEGYSEGYSEGYHNAMADIDNQK
jgi:flagellar biosynthesis/type III secretory pathway protein FliH